MYTDNIRIIQSSDLQKIAELENRCFTDNNAYSKKQLKYLITKANSYCLADVQDERIRGFIIVLFRKGTHVAGIETISVDPIFRGMGIAKKLLTEVEKEMQLRSIKYARLEVSSGNTSAINLYEKSGFKKISVLKDYYTFQYYGTNDAYRMIKYIAT